MFVAVCCHCRFVNLLALIAENIQTHTLLHIHRHHQRCWFKQHLFHSKSNAKQPLPDTLWLHNVSGAVMLVIRSSLKSSEPRGSEPAAQCLRSSEPSEGYGLRHRQQTLTETLLLHIGMSKWAAVIEDFFENRRPAGLTWCWRRWEKSDQGSSFSFVLLQVFLTINSVIKK